MFYSFGCVAELFMRCKCSNQSDVLPIKRRQWRSETEMKTETVRVSGTLFVSTHGIPNRNAPMKTSCRDTAYPRPILRPKLLESWASGAHTSWPRELKKTNEKANEEAKGKARGKANEKERMRTRIEDREDRESDRTLPNEASLTDIACAVMRSILAMISDCLLFNFCVLLNSLGVLRKRIGQCTSGHSVRREHFGVPVLQCGFDKQINRRPL